MKVIFIQDLKGQGKKGETKTVKDGYGMNFLIKNGYAVLASDGNIKQIETQKLKKELAEQEKISECEKLKIQIEKTVLKFKLKTGEHDKVFGSVSQKQIVAELKNKNIEVDKKSVIIDGSISSLGFHKIKVELHKKVIAILVVEVIKES